MGLSEGIREGKRKEKAKGELVDILPVFLSTHVWAPHPRSLVKAPHDPDGNEDPQMQQG